MVTKKWSKKSKPTDYYGLPLTGHVELKTKEIHVDQLFPPLTTNAGMRIESDDHLEKLQSDTGKLPMLRPIWRGMNPYF